MKKTVLIITSLFFLCLSSYSQTIVADTIVDWNRMSRRSGFFLNQKTFAKNAPSDAIWHWGINIAATTYVTTANQYNGQLAFAINFDTPNDIPKVYVRSTNGNGGGIWAKLLHSKGDHAIDGKLTAKEIEIKLVTGADFVFEPDYNLKPLSEVEAFVKENKHLPEIPSEKEMQANGLNVNEMQIKLLQKIEELTLYVIGQQKEIESLKQKLKEQE